MNESAKKDLLKNNTLTWMGAAAVAMLIMIAKGMASETARFPFILLILPAMFGLMVISNSFVKQALESSSTGEGNKPE